MSSVRFGHSALEAALGHLFSEPSLLVESLTHRSWAREHPRETATRDQQRLQFLGHAFLASSVSQLLFTRLASTKISAADLVCARSALLGAATCAAIASMLELERYLFLGRHDGMSDTSVARSTVEAIVGAVLIDAGTDAAHQLVVRLFVDGVDLGALAKPSPSRGAVAKLSALWTGHFRGNFVLPSPTYIECGPVLCPVYLATIVFPACDGQFFAGIAGKATRYHFKGCGPNKGVAHARAAAVALGVLKRVIAGASYHVAEASASSESRV